MPKRSCPFPCNGQRLKTHVDIRLVGKEEYQKEVYIKTSQLLTEGAKEASKANSKAEKGKGKKNIGPVFGSKVKRKCGGCNQFDANLTINQCDFCDKETCLNCSHNCFRCEGSFCHMCCILNYDERDERAFCLSCNS